MRVLMAVAALLLATSAAEAQYTFEYGGHTIRVDPDRGTVSIPGVFDNTPKKSRRARTDQGNARQQTKADPQGPDQTAPAASPQPAAVTAAPATTEAPSNSATTSNTAPRETAAIAPAPAAAPPAPASPPVAQEAAPAATPPAAPAPAALTTAPPPPARVPVPKPAENVATVAPVSPSPAPPVPRSQPQAPTPAAAHDANSPVGVWLTEENEGKVRIEPCGANLCGYSVDAKSNQNAEQVLNNMKPGKDQKWSGRILDPNTGGSYESTIALIGANALRVQGCAFGGMFCGGQTWTRLN
jgi:uncharacterized protein (DUF2147 family)